MTDDIKGLRVAILATDGFEQSELMEPRKALNEAGATTAIVSLKKGNICGWKHNDWADTVTVDYIVNDVRADAFDALLLPGGVMNPDKLRMEPAAVEFVQDFFNKDKPVAAICHGPWLVVEAGAAKGRCLTSWPSVKTDILNAGGNWVDEEVVQDGNLVTSRKPDDIPAFNRAMVKLFSGARKNKSKAAA